LICLLLALVTLAVYWPVLDAGFINYDDQGYVTDNPCVKAGLTWPGVVWAFTTDHTGNWHPLTWLSHMLDCQLFGMKAGGHHLSNVALHIINALLLFLVLGNLTGALWRSAMVAALFALHPLHVESVAWVSERKDVLCMLFWILTVGAYAKYARVPTAASYALVLLLFAFCLMAKPMGVTLPFVLLLLDYWPLKRIAFPLRHTLRSVLLHLVWEKLPLLALAILSSVVTLIVQHRAGAVAAVSALPIELRLANALASYVLYLKKMLWPTGLAPLYPYSVSAPIELMAVAVLVLAGFSLLAFKCSRQRPYLVVGWLWYLGTLVPVIGLVQVGNQSMADRYTYIPLTGLFICVVWGAADLTANWRCRTPILAAAAALTLIPYCVLTTAQAWQWKDSETLFRHTLAVTADNAIAHYNLGCVLVTQGKINEAADHFAEVVRILPTFADARSDLGQALVRQGKIEDAIASFHQALRYNPNFRQAHFGLASVLTEQGKFEEADEHWMAVLQLTATNQWVVYDQHGLLLAKQGKAEAALVQFSKAVEINSKNAALHSHLAMALDRLGRTREAIAEYQFALSLNPKLPDVLNNLAWILATRPDAEVRNGGQAVRLAEQACLLTGYRNVMIVGTLGAAYAEAGRFEEAMATARKVEALALADGNKELAEKNHKLAELFRSRQPFREPDNSATGVPTPTVPQTPSQ